MTNETLTEIDAQAILDRLPTRIQTALLDDLRSVVDHRATEIEYPIEMVFTECLFQRIASFLDPEALGFVDCKPGREQ